MPHSPSQAAPLGGLHVRKGVLQVLVNDLPADLQNRRHQRGQMGGQPIAALDPHRLNDTEKNPHKQINQEIEGTFGQQEAKSFPCERHGASRR